MYTNSQRTNLRGVKGWGSVTKLARLVSVKVTNKTHKCSEGLTVSVPDSYSLYLINKYSALTADESVGCNQAQKAPLNPLLTRTSCESLAVLHKFRNGCINIQMKSYGVSERENSIFCSLVNRRGLNSAFHFYLLWKSVPLAVELSQCSFLSSLLHWGTWWERFLQEVIFVRWQATSFTFIMIYFSRPRSSDWNSFESTANCRASWEPCWPSVSREMLRRDLFRPANVCNSQTELTLHPSATSSPL